MSIHGRLSEIRREDGFTLIEGMMAVTILAIVLVLSIQPLASSLRRIGDSREIGVAENLAQARDRIHQSAAV